MCSFPALTNVGIGGKGFAEGMGQVIYSFDADEQVLKRDYIDYSPLNSTAASKARILVSSVQDFSLSYYYFSQDKQQFFWADSWPLLEVKETVSFYPQAIRFTMSLNMGKSTQTRLKTINIPVGGLLP